MPTIADICRRYPDVKLNTMRRKLFSLAKKFSEFEPTLCVGHGRAVNVYTHAQAAALKAYFKKHPFQQKRGRLALTDAEWAERGKKRAAERRAKYTQQKGE